MTLDLHAQYKKFHQRSNRNQDDEELREMSQLARQIAFFLHQNRDKMTKTKLKQAMLLANTLASMEMAYGHTHLFSAAVVDALNKNDFIVDIPAAKIHRWNSDAENSASIYVATSTTRIGECKLGVTTLDPELRAKKYSTKYGYPLTIYRSILAKNPYVIEADIANELVNFRMTANTHGDSIEWYRIPPEKMFSIVLAHVKSNP